MWRKKWHQQNPSSCVIQSSNKYLTDKAFGDIIFWRVKQQQEIRQDVKQSLTSCVYFCRSIYIPSTIKHRIVFMKLKRILRQDEGYHAFTYQHNQIYSLCKKTSSLSGVGVGGFCIVIYAYHIYKENQHQISNNKSMLVFNPLLASKKATISYETFISGLFCS